MNGVGVVSGEKELLAVVENRTADDYKDALNTVIDLAEGILTVAPLPQTKIAAAIIGGVRFAKDNQEAIADVVSASAPAAEKAAEATKNASKKIADNIGDVFNSAKNAIGDKIQDSIDKKAQEKARKETRRVLIDGAGTRMSYKRFLENWELNETTSSAEENYLSISGCYVIARYDRTTHRDEYSDYKDIYVGQSSNMGQAIYNDIVGKGNPDIYADVKYKQEVRILLFPCDKSKLEQLHSSLIIALDADSSYNK